MATEKQIEANRLNAQKSTGPRTTERRAAVRLNGVTHGLTAETIVLKGENESDFKALFDSLEAEHDPSTPTEEALVVQLAMATWRLRRLYQQEAGFYSFKMKDTADLRKSRNLNESESLGLVVDWSNNTINMFNRQESRLERSFYRALHELQRLRKDRPAKSALVSQPAPEENMAQTDGLATSQISSMQEQQTLPTPPNPLSGPALDAKTGIQI